VVVGRVGGRATRGEKGGLGKLLSLLLLLRGQKTSSYSSSTPSSTCSWSSSSSSWASSSPPSSSSSSSPSGAGARLSIVHVRQHLRVDRPMRVRRPQQMRDLVLRGASGGGAGGRGRERGRGQSKVAMIVRFLSFHGGVESKSKYPPWSGSAFASPSRPRC